ncbi:MAG: hypothetical protein M1826_000616 [Phylliscum demangeonii]|nr:MAG: hypothetical protein M1826_000616 [Phylliscum demangeonii]
MQFGLQTHDASIVVLRTSGGKSLLFMGTATLQPDRITIAIVPDLALLDDLVVRANAQGIHAQQWSSGATSFASLMVVRADVGITGQFQHYTTDLAFGHDPSHRFHVAITRAADGLVVITDCEPTRKAMRRSSPPVCIMSKVQANSDKNCADYGLLTRHRKTAGRAHAIHRGDEEATRPFVRGLHYHVDPRPDEEDCDNYNSEASEDHGPTNGDDGRQQVWHAGRGGQNRLSAVSDVP